MTERLELWELQEGYYAGVALRVKHRQTMSDNGMKGEADTMIRI